jgi:hypothetical protein
VDVHGSTGNRRGVAIGRGAEAHGDIEDRGVSRDDGPDRFAMREGVAHTLRAFPRGHPERRRIGGILTSERAGCPQEEGMPPSGEVGALRLLWRVARRFVHPAGAVWKESEGEDGGEDPTPSLLVPCDLSSVKEYSEYKGRGDPINRL